MIKNSLLGLVLVLGVSQAFADINIYTDRNAELMDPLVEAFTAETGEQVNYLKMGGSDIISRLQAEGSNTPADIVVTKDMLYLNDLANFGLLQPMTASTSHVPAQMQNPEGLWASVTMRARTIVYNMDTLGFSEAPATYAELGDDKWAGKLCLRTSASSYNVGLVSGFIADLGYDATKDLMQSWINNLAQVPYPNDRSVLEAVENGECQIGVVNSYYLGQENDDGNNLNVGIVFADQNGLGAHINGTGAGIVAASNPEKFELANKFMEIFLSSENQYHFANYHFDYPVSSDLAPETLIADWGSFNANLTNWSVIGENVEDALDIISEVGYE